MARFKDESKVTDAFQTHLHPGEQLQHFAYGVKQPPIMLIVLLMLLAILPGAIAVALLTKEYLLGLTDKRLIALQFSSGKINVKQVLEYDRAQLTPQQVKTSKGSIFTHIRIDDPAKPFVAKFHRLGMPNNKMHSEAIADAISQA